jgi:hypothetical protein
MYSFSCVSNSCPLGRIFEAYLILSIVIHYRFYEFGFVFANLVVDAFLPFAQCNCSYNRSNLAYKLMFHFLLHFHSVIPIHDLHSIIYLKGKFHVDVFEHFREVSK